MGPCDAVAGLLYAANHVVGGEPTLPRRLEELVQAPMGGQLRDNVRSSLCQVRIPDRQDVRIG